MKWLIKQLPGHNWVSAFLMNEFILNDMQIAKTNGYTAHEMLPTDMLNALFLYFCQGAIYSYAPSLCAALYAGYC